MKLYHLTPTSNLESILKSGLKPSKGACGSVSEGENIESGVYFLTSLSEVKNHFAYSSKSGSRSWTLLEISLPDNWPLKKFREYPGLISVYSTKKIPKKYLKVIHSGGSIAFEREHWDDKDSDFLGIYDMPKL